MSIVQSKPDDLELLIKRFIRSKLRGLKPRDVDYTVSHIRQQIDCVKKWNASKVGEEFYRRYRLGLDTFAPLYDKEFYRTLSVHDFPNLFVEDRPKEIRNKKQVRKSTDIRPLKEAINQESPKSIEHLPNLEGLELPPIYILVEESIPDVRKVIVSKVKKYIAIMEFDAWLTKHGLELPQVAIANDFKEEAVNSNKVSETIENYLSILVEENRIDKDNSLRLSEILIEYFTKGICAGVYEPIILMKNARTRMASVLGEIHRKLKNGENIPSEYYELAKLHIPQFSKYKVPTADDKHSTLYKYFKLKY